MSSNAVPGCPICGQPLSVGLARGRKSGKPFVMFVCPHDGRHYRVFISHRPYVQLFLDKLEKLNEKEN